MNYNEKANMGENNMADTIDTGSLLLARGFGGYGAFGGYGGHGNFAGPSANAVRINRNADLFKLGLDRVAEENEETRRVLGEARVMDNITGGHARITDRIIDAEFRTSDRMRDIEREISTNARTAAECCCDLKLQAANDKSEILSRMEALSKENVSRDLDRAEREIIALRTQIACGCVSGCSTPCNGGS